MNLPVFLSCLHGVAIIHRALDDKYCYGVDSLPKHNTARILHLPSMGVRGLTTFLRDNRSAISKQETFKNTPGASTRPLVVDGWSLIYALYYDSGLPWVYGGEYESFAILVKNLVNAWIAVGLEPYFVFDGACQ
ncbi:hypothetical protein RSAG8_13263, partial [Rhizoctonia solani AG-8 WAC10335]